MLRAAKHQVAPAARWATAALAGLILRCAQHDRRNARLWRVGAVVAAAALLAAALLMLPRAAWGQTIPLRPTPTAAGARFDVLPQPTPPAPAVPPAAIGTPAAGAPTVTVLAAAVIPATPPAPTVGSTATAPRAEQTSVASPVTGPAAVTAAGFRAEHVGLAAGAFPPPPSGLRLAETALRLGGAPVPAEYAVNPSTRDLAAAGGRPQRLALYRLVGQPGSQSWELVAGQTVDGRTAQVRFRPAAEGGAYALLVRPLIPEAGDYAIPGGRFFRAAGAAGDPSTGGFSVVDAGPAFWTAYQRAGGEATLGRPTTRRFVADGRLAQAFERGAIRAVTGGAAEARPGEALPATAAAIIPEPAPAAD
jgi:hypothetical protein